MLLTKTIQKFVLAIVHYFLVQAGVKVEFLNFKDVPGEMSEILITCLLSFCYQGTGTYKKKVVGFCCDNCNTDFESINRKGKNRTNFSFKLGNWTKYK
jgi:hypothetical protein